MQSEKTKLLIGLKSRALWAQPEFRAKVLASRNLANNSAAQKRWWKTASEIERAKRLAQLNEARKYRAGSIRVSEGFKRLWEKPDYREQQVLARKRSWAGNREERVKALLLGRIKRRGLTSLEKRFSAIRDKYSLPYRFVGDGSVILNGLCPDFINTNGKKQAVEVAAPIFKNWRYGSVDAYERRNRERLAPLGWSVVFLYDSDLKDEKTVLSKLGV